MPTMRLIPSLGFLRGWTRGAAAVAAVLAVCVTAALWPVLAARGPVQIWFAPLTESPSGGHGPIYTEHDFPALMQPNAPWQTAASRVSVLLMPGNVVWSYPDIPTLVRFLHSRPWKVALGVGVLFDGGQCKGQEAISHDPDMNREAVHIAQMWKADGGPLDYIVMDSPLWFGHFEPSGCRFTTEEAARRASITLREMFARFPDAQLVDAEGPGWLPLEQWLPEMAAFRAALRAGTGHSMDAVTLDLHWQDPRVPLSWEETARRSAEYFHRLGMRTGQVISAPGGPRTPLPAWMEAVRQNLFRATRPQIGLDYIMINQWQGVPRLNLPENDPNAYTSLIDTAYDDLRR
jgi:hypothetical protein